MVAGQTGFTCLSVLRFLFLGGGAVWRTVCGKREGPCKNVSACRVTRFGLQVYTPKHFSVAANTSNVLLRK